MSHTYNTYFQQKEPKVFHFYLQITKRDQTPTPAFFVSPQSRKTASVRGSAPPIAWCKKLTEKKNTTCTAAA